MIVASAVGGYLYKEACTPGQAGLKAADVLGTYLITSSR